MKHQLTHISVHQTAKVLSILYGILGVLVVPFLWLASLADPEGTFPFWMTLFFPLLYLVIGYIFTAIGAALYNVVARGLGGIEFTLTDADPHLR